MRVVSKNSEADIVKHEALNSLNWRLRELAGNLLRMIRGSGGTHLIGIQAKALVDAIVSYHEKVGAYPAAHEIAAPLSIAHEPEVIEGMDEEACEEVHAQQAVIRGALQLAASRLLVQPLQGLRGERDMERGMRRYAEARSEKRRRRMAEVKAALADLAPSSKSRTRRRPRG